MRPDIGLAKNGVGGAAQCSVHMQNNWPRLCVLFSLVTAVLSLTILDWCTSLHHCAGTGMLSIGREGCQQDKSRVQCQAHKRRARRRKLIHVAACDSLACDADARDQLVRLCISPVFKAAH